MITNPGTLEINSFSLKMLIHSLKTSYENKTINLNEAVDELHQTCTKNEKLYAKDIKKIFNEERIL